MDRKQQLKAHAKRVGNIVRCICAKRALAAVDPSPSLLFWCLIHGILLDTVVLEWSKVFGNDSEPTHWKVVVGDQDAFRQQLLTALSIDEPAWNKYWGEIKTYRNSEVGHYLNDPAVTHYPGLDLALRSSYFYYAYLVAELEKLNVQQLPIDLEEYAGRFSAECKQLAEMAVSATAGVEEKVISLSNREHG